MIPMQGTHSTAGTRFFHIAMSSRRRFPTSLTTLGLAGLLLVSSLAWSCHAALDQNERNLTRVTAELLEHSQFAHHPLDHDLAAKFLDFYLDALDGGHSIFLQSDVQEFGAYLPHLAEHTTTDGDTAPASAIFARFLERLGQRSDFVAQLLKTEKFDFTGHDSYSFDREHAERPHDLAAAQSLWREQLRAEYLQEKLAEKKAEDIPGLLTRRYARTVQTMKKLSGDEVLDVYLNALAHVYDPHSDYFGHAERENFAIAMNLSLVGIGATLQSEDGYCKVGELVPGGPAARSGLLKPGDRIVAVAQEGKEPVDIVEMPLTDAVELIRGAKDTKVILTLVPAGADAAARKTITLVRDKVKLDEQRAKARIIDLPVGTGGVQRIGVLDLPAFYSSMDSHDGSRLSSTADVRRLIEKLNTENIRGLILDLRRNGGGALDEAINLAGLFVPHGPVVQTKESNGHVTVGKSHDPSVLYDGPLIVLTSRMSASASEIVAGALQDYGRAIIVGDSTTFGKGTVQSVVPLAPIMDQNGIAHSTDPGELKLTIAKFYRPSGASTQLRGVAADIQLPSLTEPAPIGEAKLKDPLPWDQIPSSEFTVEDRVAPFVAQLRARSQHRIEGDLEFRYLHEELVKSKDSYEKKSVSLNEAERRGELDAAKKRTAEEDKEILARHDAAPVTYEITLKNVDDKGLPAPLSATAKAAEEGATVTPKKDDAAPDPALGRDADLTEAERILADYAVLMNQPAPAITAKR
jgi:carboxyl-terminal processing protease